ncbi:alpha/beta-hydrolase [Hyaloscypha hepaticicola]|uniref:Alpha/beta-hydrolase n=1 Tax=Hyaloscypha hepaticicola TaxID=2082293 RepID=A0A2J6QH31_9HELO|nr:alpha/beta-hydrolase [Hyaloscypha hepaticicola]
MSTSSTDIDWNKDAHQGLVSIGTHQLALNVSGPDRSAGQPVVIIIHGLTGTMTEWAAARRCISSFSRVIDYDRSGLGSSEEGQDPPTGLTGARELSALLKAANIEPPFITVAHSWGAILNLEFINMRPQDIAGTVFSDGTAPGFWSVLPMFATLAEVKSVIEGLDYFETIGMKTETKLSPAEWDAHMKVGRENERHKRQATKEFEFMHGTFVEIGKKDLLNQTPPKLGDRPVCVIKGNHATRDIQRLYDKGVERGNGTEEERKKIRDAIELWFEKEKAFHESFLKLSTKGKWIDASESGHWPHQTEPELVAEGVRWILSQLDMK